MNDSAASRFRTVLIGVAVVLLPWCAGLLLLWLWQGQSAHASTSVPASKSDDARDLAYKGLQVDWTFYPHWQFKPLLLGKAAYFVFVFHYTNNGDHAIYLMPSYTFAAPHERWQAANEEIATYIEDEIEDELGVTDEPGLIYRVPAGGTRHYIVVFRKSVDVRSFCVDVDIWQDRTLRIHYRRTTEGSGKSSWLNAENEWIEKYLGRG